MPISVFHRPQSSQKRRHAPQHRRMPSKSSEDMRIFVTLYELGANKAARISQYLHFWELFMGHLAKALLASERMHVISQCAELVRARAAAASGVSGLAIKGGLRLIEKLKPNIIEEMVDGLLDTFCQVLEPLYAPGDIPIGEHVRHQWPGIDDTVAETLLSATDARAQSGVHPVLAKTYAKLRPFAKKQVIAAVPELAELIASHVGAASNRSKTL